MAFTADFLCDSFKVEILLAEHDLTAAADDIKLALYDDTATMDNDTTDYTGSTTGELANSGNYITAGLSLTNVTPTLDGSTAICDFSPDAVWSTATFTAYGALLYNNTHASKAAIAVLWFNGAKTATAGDFTVQFPAAAAATAIIRIA